MHPPMLLFRSWRGVGLLVGGWSLVGLALGAHATLALWADGRPFDPVLVGRAASGAVPWVGLTPLVVGLAHRYPLSRRPRRLRHGALHLGVAVGTNLAVVLGMRLLDVFVGLLPADQLGNAVSQGLLRSFFFHTLLYAVVLAAAHAHMGYTRALVYLQRYRERTLRSARLEAQLAKTRLALLQHQLNPHLLFNTLHTVAALVGRDAVAARSVLADLSDLLRNALDYADAPVVPLDEELHLLDAYVRIARTRFEDRLQIHQVIDPICRTALVPTLLLQPLVENALQHGIARTDRGGTVTVTVVCREADLVLTVTDDGAGLGAAPLIEGIGLRSTRDRLAELYGPRAVLDLHTMPEGGTRVIVRLPFVTR